MSIAAVVLAAGASTRLGRPKQTLQLGGESLVERSARLAAEAGYSPIIIVTQPKADFAQALQKQGWIVVVNELAATGMSSSIRCGIDIAQSLNASGTVLMTCDQPSVTVSHMQALASEPGRRAGSEYSGRIGVPAYFPWSDFAALQLLEGDAGARELLRGARFVSYEALALDIDTEEDFRTAQATFG